MADFKIFFNPFNINTVQDQPVKTNVNTSFLPKIVQKFLHPVSFKSTAKPETPQPTQWEVFSEKGQKYGQMGAQWAYEKRYFILPPSETRPLRAGYFQKTGREGFEAPP